MAAEQHPRRPAASGRSSGSTTPPPRIGWREWIAIPDWGVDFIKAKVDTGARTSSLHVEHLERFERDGENWVRFTVRPWQRSRADAVRAEAKIIASRNVKSSTGTIQRRPVIRTEVMVAGVTVLIEITLTSRDEMGFRMLLGREAMRRRFVVDPGASYLGGQPPRPVRQKNKGET